jgi:hypothetical protein
MSEAPASRMRYVGKKKEWRKNLSWIKAVSVFNLAKFKAGDQRLTMREVYCNDEVGLASAMPVFKAVDSNSFKHRSTECVIDVLRVG